MKKPNKNELLQWLDTIEKLMIKIISIAGWVKILMDVIGS